MAANISKEEFQSVISISCNSVLQCAEQPVYSKDANTNDPKLKQTIKDIYKYCNSYLPQITDPDYTKELYNNYTKTKPKINLNATMYLQNIGQLVEVSIKDNYSLLLLIAYINIIFLKNPLDNNNENSHLN